MAIVTAIINNIIGKLSSGLVSNLKPKANPLLSSLTTYRLTETYLHSQLHTATKHRHSDHTVKTGKDCPNYKRMRCIVQVFSKRFVCHAGALNGSSTSTEQEFYFLLYLEAL